MQRAGNYGTNPFVYFSGRLLFEDYNLYTILKFEITITQLKSCLYLM